MAKPNTNITSHPISIIFGCCSCCMFCSCCMPWINLWENMLLNWKWDKDYLASNFEKLILIGFTDCSISHIKDDSKIGSSERNALLRSDWLGCWSQSWLFKSELQCSFSLLQQSVTFPNCSLISDQYFSPLFQISHPKLCQKWFKKESKFSSYKYLNSCFSM